MEITIKAEPEEIVALVDGLQGQRNSMNHTVTNFYGNDNNTRKFLPADATRYGDVTFCLFSS